MTEQQQNGWGVVTCGPDRKRPQFLKYQLGVMQSVGAIALFVPLLLSTSDLAQATPELQPYARNGGITQGQINHLNRSYAKPQSYQAIQSLRRRGELGSPNYVSEFREVYEIRGGDQYQAPQKFHILYRLSPRCNYRCSEAFDWYRQ